MALHEEWDIAAAAGDVQRALVKPEVWSHYGELTAAQAHDFELVTERGSTTTLFHRTMSTRPLPFLVRRLLPDNLDITESVVWGPPTSDGLYSADVLVDIANPQVTFRGVLAMHPVGDGSRLSIDGPSPTTALPRPLICLAGSTCIPPPKSS